MKFTDNFENDFLILTELSIFLSTYKQNTHNLILSPIRFNMLCFFEDIKYI